MPARASAASGCLPVGAVLLNQRMNAPISRGTRAEGGASKWTFGAWMAPEMICWAHRGCATRRPPQGRCVPAPSKMQAELPEGWFSVVSNIWKYGPAGGIGSSISIF
jgi:hypothetical protein